MKLNLKRVALILAFVFIFSITAISVVKFTNDSNNQLAVKDTASVLADEAEVTPAASENTQPNVLLDAEVTTNKTEYSSAYAIKRVCDGSVRSRFAGTDDGGNFYIVITLKEPAMVGVIRIYEAVFDPETRSKKTTVEVASSGSFKAVVKDKPLSMDHVKNNIGITEFVIPKQKVAKIKITFNNLEALSCCTIWEIEGYESLAPATEAPPTQKPVPTERPKTEYSLSVGDYVQMGTYYDEPILWRVVDFDNINGPLIMTDRIIAFKAFDAPGEHENDPNQLRSYYGSNDWETSTIRAWLNSDAGPGEVSFPCGNPPKFAFNSYDQEAGFLTNFTERERTAFKTVTQKCALAMWDTAKADEGSETLLLIDGVNDMIEHVRINFLVNNFEKCYKQNVTDKMFLIDLAQAEAVYNNLGKYYMGIPTDKAIENSTHPTNLIALQKDKYWYYWLRTPHCKVDAEARFVMPSGRVYSQNVNIGTVGIRPAFYCSSDERTIFTDGDGTKENPYKIS